MYKRLRRVNGASGCDLFETDGFTDPCTDEDGDCTPGEEGFTCGERGAMPTIGIDLLPVWEWRRCVFRSQFPSCAH